MSAENKCKTFKILKKTNGLNASTCPFERMCDGTSCVMLKEKPVNLREDENQERQILSWLASQRKN